MLAGVFDQARQVVGQQIVVFHQRSAGILHELQIALARGIAFFDRLTRIVRPFTLSFRAGERHIRAEQREQLVRRADGRLSEIPSGIGCERDGDLGEPNPRELVAVLIDLRNEKGSGVPGAPSWATSRFDATLTGKKRPRRCDGRKCRERDVGRPNERPVL